jgi:hypothetical protein
VQLIWTKGGSVVWLLRRESSRHAEGAGAMDVPVVRAEKAEGDQVRFASYNSLILPIL